MQKKIVSVMLIVFMLLLLLTVTGCGKGSTPEDTFKKFESAINNGDFDGVLDCFEPSVRQMYEGIMALADGLSDYSTSDILSGLFAFGASSDVAKVKVISVEPRYKGEDRAIVKCKLMIISPDGEENEEDYIAMKKIDGKWYFSTDTVSNADIAEFGGSSDTGSSGGGNGSPSSESQTAIRELTDIDLFENLRFSYTGVSGNADVWIDTGNCGDLINSYVSFWTDASNLANGDGFIVYANFDGDYFEELGYNVLYDRAEFEAKGIDEGRTVDPFEGLEVQFSGISPFGGVSFNNAECDDDVQLYVTFSYGDGYVRNGDKITVTATATEEAATTLGLKLGKTEREYTVSGLPEYIESVDDIDFTELKAQLSDYVVSKTTESEGSNYFLGKYISNYYRGNYKKTLSVNFKDSYLFTVKSNAVEKYLKNKDGVNCYNVLKLMYSTEFLFTDGKTTLTFYFTVNAENVTKYPDGTLKWGIADPDMLEFNYISFDTNYDDMTNTLVTKYRDRYNVSSVDIGLNAAASDAGKTDVTADSE